MDGKVVTRVRLVEDYEATAEAAAPIPHASGYAVDRVATVVDALVHVHSAHPPIIPLVLALPETSGISSLWADRECDHDW